MKIVWNKKTGLPVVEFEEEDISNANHIRQLLDGKNRCEKCSHETESFAWRVLEGYFAAMRLSIEERGKAHARGRATKDLCSNDFSILDGFDVAVGMPKKIIIQSDIIRDTIPKETQYAESEYAAE